jgi:hypothetical protein
MPITKATASSIAPAAKGDLVVGSATNDASVLAVGSADQVLTVDSSTATGLKWATPASGAITWTQRKTPTGDAIRAFAYNGSNLYVAAGGNGKLFSSADAITWTERTSGFGSNQIQFVAFGNGLFVAVGNNGTITTSSDAITWTARTSNMSTNTIFHVIYADNTWVAVGNGGGSTNTGGVTYSTDGITWTRKSMTPSVGTTYYMVAYNGTNFIVATSLNANNFIYASTPSATWTAGLDSVIGQAMVFIVYDGTRTIYASQSQWAYSTSATLATQNAYSNAPYEPSDGSNSQERSILYDGRIYISDTYLQSFSTTPVNTNYSNDISTPIIAPSSRLTTGSSLANDATAIFVNATGIIIGGIQGRIYTSF